MAEIIGNKIIKLVSVDSTNNYATAHLSNRNWEEGTVVFSYEQINGRGQINNSWESEPLKNILISIVLYPEFLPAQFQFMISKIIALGLYDVVSLYVDNVAIKWPNDIYVDDRKIAGILIENAIMGNVLSSSVAGVGLNVNQSVFKSGAPNPVSLSQLTLREFDISSLLGNMFEAIDKWYLKLKSGEFDMISLAYRERMYRIGEVAEFKDKAGVYSGIIRGVNEIGQLEIQPEKGRLRSYNFKEVEFI